MVLFFFFSAQTRSEIRRPFLEIGVYMQIKPAGAPLSTNNNRKNRGSFFESLATGNAKSGSREECPQHNFLEAAPRASKRTRTPESAGQFPAGVTLTDHTGLL